MAFSLPDSIIWHSFGAPTRPLLFFIHGWPDTADLWKSQIIQFQETHYCVCVTLPGFAGDLGRARDFPVLADQLAELVRTIKLQNATTHCTLVGHDWGAYLSYLVQQRHAELIDQIVAMDVGAIFKPESLVQGLAFVAYQWWLVAAYAVGKCVPFAGNAMTSSLVKMMGIRHVGVITSHMNYLYYYFWRGILFKKFKTSLLQSYEVTCPILYFYGERKPFHFHATGWIKMLASRPDCRVVGLPYAGHWLMLDDSETVNDAITAWLQSNCGTATCH